MACFRFLLAKFFTIICPFLCVACLCKQSFEVFTRWLSHDTLISIDHLHDAVFPSFTIMVLATKFLTANKSSNDPKLNEVTDFSVWKEIVTKVNTSKAKLLKRVFNVQTNTAEYFTADHIGYDGQFVYFTFSKPLPVGTMITNRGSFIALVMSSPFPVTDAGLSFHSDTDITCSRFFNIDSYMSYLSYTRIVYRLLPAPFVTDCRDYSLEKQTSQCSCFTTCLKRQTSSFCKWKGLKIIYSVDKINHENFNNLLNECPYFYQNVRKCNKMCTQVDCEFQLLTNVKRNKIQLGNGGHNLVAFIQDEALQLAFIPAFGLIDVLLYFSGILSFWFNIWDWTWLTEICKPPPAPKVNKLQPRLVWGNKPSRGTDCLIITLFNSL